MSIEHCANCGCNIDTDYNAEHFDECTMGPDCDCDDCEAERGPYPGLTSSL